MVTRDGARRRGVETSEDKVENNAYLHSEHELKAPEDLARIAMLALNEPISSANHS
jgi:hypothetical protein